MIDRTRLVFDEVSLVDEDRLDRNIVAEGPSDKLMEDQEEKKAYLGG